ncbi:MAG TPA: cytochrome b N-terminal domain-containing protein, partial [Myxococcaceae bacterium]|nr:cytochrome b N-terminal domain-containing protein [Myxococcaceae bacterium]
NELAFFATSVGTDSVKGVPLVGQWLLEVMRGGQDVSINTLYRFFALHVVVLPLTAIAIIGLHLLFIQRQGMAPPMAHQRQATPRQGLKFFPDFFLRDLLLWLLCLTALVTLVFLMPYGPRIPGIDWELGKKANPLAPAYPGIKPEWYFLWIYQLLKEFPPHLFGVEGPQMALALVTVLLLTWAVVPWLDRRAVREQPSPAFNDLGVAALLFIGFLTLKAWDIGGLRPGQTGLPDAAASARACAFIVLGAGAAVTGLRFALARHRWFALSGAALLQVALHGLAGVGYLTAGAISVALAAAAIAALRRRPPKEVAAP